MAARTQRSPSLNSREIRRDTSPLIIISIVPMNANKNPKLCFNVIPWRKNRIDSKTITAGRDVLINNAFMAVVVTNP